MPYCVHCGTAVADAAAPCPACNRTVLPAAQTLPAAQKRSGMPKAAIVALIAVVGCLPAVAALGIVLAIVIPNFIDALQMAKQKRTVADLALIAEALEEWAAARPAAESRYPDATSIPELAAELAPYAEIPRVDGWKRPFRYSCARAAVGVGCNAYRIASAGADGVFEHQDPWHYEPRPFERADHGADVVLGSDGFVRWPETL